MSAQNLTLLTDLYELTMMQGYFETQENQTVVFDVFFRDNRTKADIPSWQDWIRSLTILKI